MDDSAAAAAAGTQDAKKPRAGVLKPQADAGTGAPPPPAGAPPPEPEWIQISMKNIPAMQVPAGTMVRLMRKGNGWTQRRAGEDDTSDEEWVEWSPRAVAAYQGAWADYTVRTAD